MNDPAELAESKAKHAMVIKYLTEMIRKSSEDKQIYRVAYYLKADTKMAQYNQLQTLFLDEDLKKIDANYSHLKLAY